MFRLALIYEESGKRYFIDFEVAVKVVGPELAEKIKVEALKEVQKK